MNETKKEILLKKLNTNIKSAQSIFALSGILGIIYLVRYFIKGVFDFYFSLSFTELMLKLSKDNLLSVPVAYALIGLFLAVFAFLAINAVKSEKWLSVCIGIYAFDFLCLFFDMFVLSYEAINAERFVDVIFHLLVMMFLVVGLVSMRKLKALSN